MPVSTNGTFERFYIPDTLANWPWPRAINPAYEDCKISSSAWCEKYGAFSSRAQKAFNLCDFNLLASLAYAHLPPDVNRVGCDLMNLFFVVDEHTDAMDPRSVQDWVNIVIDALHNPHKPRPEGEPIVGEVARTFWENGMKCLGPSAQHRFVETFATYLQNVVTQAQDRDKHLFRDVISYMDVRRETIGAKPSFALLEHDMELPEDVFNHPLLENLRTWAIDMLILGNDLCSYNVEQSRGDDTHNIVTLAMKQEDTNIHGALAFVSDMHDRLADQFISNYQHMPSFGEPIDEWVSRYIEGLGNWVRANDSWSFESWRYFKGDGLRVQKERWVDLLPPAPKDELTSSSKLALLSLTELEVNKI
ncbi:terpenoid synthase [Crepidotus variabilis]|uniref:Terpene synthase n=1 Tax=Crepidotus variabilis TaxID=179855 RepID=A0A9P6JME9_9AGAR|nr:terpenoid synthase [Crepidotus variabilis]